MLETIEFGTIDKSAVGVDVMAGFGVENCGPAGVDVGTVVGRVYGTTGWVVRLVGALVGGIGRRRPPEVGAEEGNDDEGFVSGETVGCTFVGGVGLNVTGIVYEYGEFTGDDVAGPGMRNVCAVGVDVISSADGDGVAMGSGILYGDGITGATAGLGFVEDNPLDSPISWRFLFSFRRAATPINFWPIQRCEAAVVRDDATTVKT